MNGEGKGPAPRRVRVSEAGDEIVIRGGLRSGSGAVAVILGGAVVIGLLFVFFSPRPEAIAPAAPFLLASAAVLLIAWVVVQRLLSEHLHVGESEVVYERRFARWCWQKRTVSRAARIEARVERRGRRRGVAIAGGGQRFLVAGGLSAAGREWVHEWISQRTAIRA